MTITIRVDGFTARKATLSRISKNRRVTEDQTSLE